MVKSVMLGQVSCQFTVVASEKRHLQATDTHPCRYGIRHADDDLDWPVEIKRDYVLANNWGVLIAASDLIPEGQERRPLTDDEILLLVEAEDEQ